MIRLLALLLTLTCGLAQAQTANLTAFAPMGPTVTVTAATSAPTPVQAASSGGSTQYILTNIGSVTAFITYAGSSADATTNCVVPTGTATLVIPILPLTQFVFTAFNGAWFCGLTSSGTAIIYISPGRGT